jgi:hypothetical protein
MKLSNRDIIKEDTIKFCIKGIKVIIFIKGIKLKVVLKIKKVLKVKRVLIGIKGIKLKVLKRILLIIIRIFMLMKYWYWNRVMVNYILCLSMEITKM